jgi:DNA-directed RNA polymerase specialized sigma24 family protein
MYALALKMVRNHDDAADIGSRCFSESLRSAWQLSKKSSFHTWLYRITVNYCIIICVAISAAPS